MAVSNNVTFWEMFREVPVRTTMASVVPILVGVAQFLNGYVHGVPMVRIAGFTAGMIVAAVLATQYNLVTFRRSKLQQDLFDEDERP